MTMVPTDPALVIEVPRRSNAVDIRVIPMEAEAEPGGPPGRPVLILVLVPHGEQVGADLPMGVFHDWAPLREFINDLETLGTEVFGPEPSTGEPR